ncbi:MAG: AmmeMemoRadiSam system protein B [Candidatus Calescibacterium sp.]|nr:AmmeMemoRadiSam system protein B [Candidatus Calescibacterium sp.]MCX7972184.1 AmmeMemoRadiSam system protein B [bacterium]MDW8194874.1 AmmeMemoRadiSam system protein B [Candidatus Calescibacterium sp.]
MKKAIRYVDIKPISEDLFIVDDPFGVFDSFMVNRITLMIMFLFDGTRTEEEVRVEFIRRTGIFIPHDQFIELVEFFRENGLFLDDSFHKIKENRIREIVKRGSLEFYFSDKDFPSDPQELIVFLGIDKVDGLGDYTAAIMPHIDLRVASETYYKTYDRLKKTDSKRVFVFGVSHYFHKGLFSVFPLDWETPFGLVSTDKEAVRKISSKFNFDVFENVLSYRKEHSIAFHLPYIKRLFENVKVLGILVSYSDDLRSACKVLDELAHFIAENYPDSIFISSVDLSHVGKKFGDDRCFDPEEVDMKYLEFVRNIRPEEALDYLIEIDNFTRIDGILTNYLFLKVIKNIGLNQGSIVDYKKHIDKYTDSIVSYSSIVFK